MFPSDQHTQRTSSGFLTHRRKVFRDIRHYRGRSILVILSILIGVFGVSVMISITDLLNQQIDQDIRPEHISHTHVYVISAQQSVTGAENQRYLQEIRQLPNVIDAEGQAIYPLSWKASSETIFESGFIVAFTEPFGEGDREPISRITAGRYPQPGEIVVEQRFADYHGIQLGDHLHFENTGEQSWPVVGLVIYNYFSFTPAAPNSALQPIDAIFAHYDDAQRIVGFSGLSGFNIRYDDTASAEANLDTLVATISSRTPYVTAFVTHDNPEANFVATVTRQVTAAMDTLGIIALLVSGLLVINVMNTIIVEQRRQIGVLKSLGGSFRDIFLIYAGMAFVYGVIGTVLGLLLAFPAAASTVHAFSGWVYIDGYSHSPLGLGIGAVMGVIVPVIVALVPVWHGTRITIFDAITDRGITSRWGLTRMSRFIGRLPLSATLTQAVSNIWQNKSRLSLTGLTLTAAAAAFMAATAMDESLMRFIDKAEGLHPYEIRITLQQPNRFEDIATLINTQVEGIAGVYPGFDVAVGVDGFASQNAMTEGSNQITVNGFDPATPTFNLDLIDGDGWRSDPTRQGVVISMTIASALKHQSGDTLDFILNGNSHSYEILGVIDYGFDAVFTDWRELAVIGNYTDNTGSPLPRIIYVKLADHAPSFETIDTRIASLKSVLTAAGITATYLNQPEAGERQAQMASMIGISFQVMAIVMAAVGAVGLMTVLSMAVFERQKEIGIMRSIGARSRTVMIQFLLEGILVSLIAWIIALPLSLVMGEVLIDVLPFDHVLLIYRIQVILLGLGGIIVIAAAASMLPALLATRKTVADI
ncbi:MAG: ABC transporter permease, partial [Chloroflexota bacterium]